MSQRPTSARAAHRTPEFRQMLGHPAPVVDAVHDGVLGALRLLRHPLGAGAVHRRAVLRRRGVRPGAAPAAPTAPTSRWCMPAAIFGGYVADQVIGYQRSILLGAVIMAAGPVHDHAARAGRSSSSAWRRSSSATACSSRTSRRWSASCTRQRRPPRSRLHDLLHGHQRRRAASRRC